MTNCLNPTLPGVTASLKYPLRGLREACLILLVVLLTWPEASWAGPLQRDEVAADAKWLLHFDYDQFKNTAVGKFLEEKLIKPRINKLEEQIGSAIAKPLEGIGSITVYGSDYSATDDSCGVLLIKANEKTITTVKQILESQSQPRGKNQIPLVRPAANGTDLFYAINDEIYLSLQKEGAIIVSKSPVRVDAARRVLENKAANLNNNDTFTDYPPVENAFVLLAIAEGFNQDATIPPQARFLKMAEGGRLVLGEASKNVFIDLALRGRDNEVSQQIQQIIQGMLALFAFTQSDNEERMWIAKAAKVANAGRFVFFNMKLTTKRAIDEIAAKTEINGDADATDDSTPRSD